MNFCLQRLSVFAELPAEAALLMFESLCQPNTEILTLRSVETAHNFDHPDAFDIDAMRECMAQLRVRPRLHSELLHSALKAF